VRSLCEAILFEKISVFENLTAKSAAKCPKFLDAKLMPTPSLEMDHTALDWLSSRERSNQKSDVGLALGENFWGGPIPLVVWCG